jgi:hypothetical protein
MAVENKITKNGSIVGAAGGLLQNSLESAIGGISPLNDFGKYFTGLRAIIKINDRLFGFAFAVTMNIKYQTDEIWTIDNTLPHELAPQKMIANGTISMFHIPGRGPGTRHITPNVLSLLNHRYITIDISDQTTGETIFKTDKAMIVGRYQDVQADKISTIKLDWKAIEWQTENAPAEPTGASESADTGDSGLIPNFNLF